MLFIHKSIYLNMLKFLSIFIKLTLYMYKSVKKKKTTYNLLEIQITRPIFLYKNILKKINKIKHTSM